MSIRRDYKRTTTRQRRKTTVRGHGLLVVTLILTGLFGGLLAYIKRGKPPSASTAAALPVTGPSKTPGVLVASPSQATPVTVMEPTPVKPKYDFYVELPKRQIGVQRESASPRSGLQPSLVPTQPVVNSLRKPEAPHKTTTTPTVTAKNP